MSASQPLRRRYPLLWIVPFAAALCACPPVPKRADSLALTPAAPDLNLVVVPTENTNNAIKFADDNDANHVGKALGLAFSFNEVGVEILALRKEQPLNTLVSLLRANFKSVTKVASLNEAKAQGADIIAMLDFYQDFPLKFELGAGVAGVMTIDEALLLMDPSGRELGKVSAGVKGDVGAYNKELAKQGFFAIAVSAVKPSFKLYVEMQDELMAKFQAALESSEPLKRYAAERRAGTAPVAAAPAAAGPRSDADRPGYRLAEDPDKFAVVVGVEDYLSLARADYAERDARAVREHLRALGYPDRNVVLLAGREAGKSGLEKYLESWLPRNVNADSRVFFYFAGHGAPDVKSGRPYLMPWDGDAAFLDATAYPVARLYERLAALKAKRVVVALDAGFSGAGARSVVAKGARPLVAKADASLPPGGIAALYAASSDELAGADKTREHGLFTDALLKALNERGGDATLRSLYELLKPRVQDAARRESRDQTPLLLSADRPEDVKL